MINAAAMMAALFCYILIIPRILNVVKQKSQVMQIFADISDIEIKEMLKHIGEISIQKTTMKDSEIREKISVKEKEKEPEVVVTNEEKMPVITGGVNPTKLTEEIIATQTLGNAEQKNEPNVNPEELTRLAKVAKKRESLKEAEYQI